MWFKDTWKVKGQNSLFWEKEKKKRKIICVEVDIIDFDDKTHAAIVILYWGKMVEVL